MELKRNDVQKLVLSQQFQELEVYFGEKLNLFLQGQLSDYQLDYCLSSLNLYRRELEADLQAWLEEYPASYSAHLAIANYYLNIAWCARGTAMASATTNLQFETMQTYFEQAQIYIQRGLNLFAHPVGLLMVGMHMQAAAASDFALDYYAEATKYYARSPSLSEVKLWSLQPKWGGSLEDMASFLQTCMTYDWSASDFRQFSAYFELTHADVLLCSGESERAFQALLSLTERLADDSYFLRTLAAYHLRREEYPAAARLLAHANSLQVHPEACYSLAEAYQGMQEPELQRQALELAAQLGSGAAAAKLAYLLRSDLEQGDAAVTARVGREIALWCRLGTEQYSAEAMFQDGCRYFLGLGIPKDEYQAHLRWEQAGHWGSVLAIDNCMLAYWDGRYGMQQDLPRARYWAGLGADLNSDTCIAAYGRMLFKGQGGAKDSEAAVPYLLWAAEQDDERAMAELVRAYWRGDGIPADRNQAQNWLARLQELDQELYRELKAELSGPLSWLKRWF